MKMDILGFLVAVVGSSLQMGINNLYYELWLLKPLWVVFCLFCFLNRKSKKLTELINFLIFSFIIINILI